MTKRKGSAARELSWQDLSGVAAELLPESNTNRMKPTNLTMKTFTAVLISCSLAFAATAMAQQQDDEQQAQKKKQSEKEHAAKESQPADKPEAAKREHAKTPAEAATAKETKAPAEAKAKPQATEPVTKTQTETKAKPAGAKAKESAEQRERAPAATANKPANATPAVAQSPAAAPAQANKQNAAAAKKPDAQAVQTIKAQHANFHAQPKPEKVPPVTFNQSYRINGADQWQGENYSVFRSYHPEMHDQGWYRSHYNRVELIGGGYYYWNNGYWYPAWGYSPTAQYYAYDGPIYVGHRAEPADQVIADVQASLQQQGYYRGEVDGLLGPLTREALAAYQSDNGLYTTSAIDQPTLDSLGMG